MHENEKLEAYQVKKNLKNLEETLRKKFGVSERGLGGERMDRLRNMLSKMTNGSRWTNI